MGKNKTIYFRTGIYEKLPPDAGPLINDLLEAHFQRIELDIPPALKDKWKENDKIMTTPPAETSRTPAASAMAEEHRNLVNASSEKPCCANKSNRCQHWDWDGDSVEWVNSISGRRVAA